MAIEKGKLVRWIDEKGFGFIKPENGSNEIFIHISALKSMSRKPIVGVVIQYQIGFDSNGKTRAVDAKIEGVSQAMALLPLDQKRKSARPLNEKERTHRNLTAKTGRYTKGFPFVPILVCIGMIVLGYYKFLKPRDIVATIDPPTVEVQPGQQVEHFQCQGKVWCTQMSSYEEAVYYIRNCQGTNMDGDGDGIPCEQQFNKW